MNHEGIATLDGESKIEATPQQLLLSFFGRFVLDQEAKTYVSSRVLLDVLRPLDVTETATRAALTRMVRAELLQRQQTGRVAAFGLTPRSVEVLRQGRTRVVSERPFTPDSDEWTLLSYTVPESRRDVRHQLRSELQWAGFGRLRDGLWIAPGIVEPERILNRIDAPDADTYVFAGKAVGGIPPERFVRTTWNLDHIASEHQRFIRTWSNLHQAMSNPVTTITAIGADWLQLLRQDPGLPLQYLPSDWPAQQSVATYRTALELLQDPAQAMLDRMIASGAHRK